MESARQFLGSLIALSLLATVALAADLHPLESPDTSSPRAAMKSCQDFIGRYGSLIQQQFVSTKQVPEQAIDDLEDKIARCFDLSDVPGERIDDVDSEVAIYLQEILDRIEVPREQDMPDAAAVKEGELSRWKVPGTDITMVKVKEGPRESTLR